MSRKAWITKDSIIAKNMPGHLCQFHIPSSTVFYSNDLFFWRSTFFTIRMSTSMNQRWIEKQLHCCLLNALKIEKLKNDRRWSEKAFFMTCEKLRLIILFGCESTSSLFECDNLLNEYPKLVLMHWWMSLTAIVQRQKHHVLEGAF